MTKTYSKTRILVELGLLASLLLIQNLFTKSYQIVQNSLTRFP